MVTKLDLGSENFLAKPLKAMKDESRIQEFYASKQNYYKSLDNRSTGVWKTTHGNDNSGGKRKKGEGLADGSF